MAVRDARELPGRFSAPGKKYRQAVLHEVQISARVARLSRMACSVPQLRAATVRSGMDRRRSLCRGSGLALEGPGPGFEYLDQPAFVHLFWPGDGG